MPCHRNDTAYHGRLKKQEEMAAEHATEESTAAEGCSNGYHLSSHDGSGWVQSYLWRGWWPGTSYTSSTTIQLLACLQITIELHRQELTRHKERIKELQTQMLPTDKHITKCCPQISLDTMEDRCEWEGREDAKLIFFSLFRVYRWEAQEGCETGLWSEWYCSSTTKF